MPLLLQTSVSFFLPHFANTSIKCCPKYCTSLLLYRSSHNSMAAWQCSVSIVFGYPQLTQCLPRDSASPPTYALVSALLALSMFCLSLSTFLVFHLLLYASIGLSWSPMCWKLSGPGPPGSSPMEVWRVEGGLVQSRPQV